MTITELIKKILNESDQPLTAEEILIYAQQKGYDKQTKSEDALTLKKNIGGRLSRMLNKDRSIFANKDSRTWKYYTKPLHSISENTQDTNTQNNNTKINYKEKDLHQFLTYFGKDQLGIYTHTINHSASTKKQGGFGEWSHPDMVGCKFIFEKYNNEVPELQGTMNKPNIKLYSFELKRKLDPDTLRASFFQAVSNSSWANEGYLVAANIDQDPDFRNEVDRLSSSHGIGIIELNTTNPKSSKILYPAKEKDDLDWETINKMLNNSDFKGFIKRILKDSSAKEIRKEKYDEILTLRN